MRKNKGFNKLEEAILKMVNKPSTTTDIKWDEYGNPIPKQAGENTPDDNDTTEQNHNKTLIS